MNTLKKIMATGLAAATILSTSAMAVPASAANKTCYNTKSYSYTHYTSMKLSNKRQSGYALFYIGCGSFNTGVKVKLTNGSGRWLWESNLGYRNGYFRFNLGNDNSSYRFYFKKTCGNSQVAINFVGGGNITR